MAPENFTRNFTNNPQFAEKILFHWFDYTLFGLMMAVSVAIGIYFGFIKKQESFVDYFLGGRNMKTFPVAMSIIASEVSGKEFIGIPSDIYTYGMTYWLSIFPLMIGCFLTYKIYLPVFYQLQLANSFEYLKMRFDNKNCLLATFLMMLAWILTMPITLYIPALTFNQVSDMNMHAVILSTSIICTFYTAIGGLKTVIWTDALQFTIMMIAMVVVLIFGCLDTGGIQHIFQKSYDGGRIFINFDPDPANRTAFWSILFGSTFSVMAFLVACQISVQKFQSLPNFRNVKWAMILFLIGTILIKNMSTLTGLIIYTRYADCDPVTTEIVSTADQLLPYYLMDVVGKIPGLPGIFTAGIFCACLSTQSTDLNTLAGLIYKEFLKPFLSLDTTEKRASDIMKILVVVVGIISTVLVYAVMHLGSIYPLIESIGGMGTGPLFAMFTLGMVVPFANSKGTFIGAVSGLLFMSWIVIGAEYHLSQGGVLTPKLPTSVDGCDFDLNAFNLTMADEKVEYVPPWIYRISFYYNTFMGFTWTMITGIIVSLSTGGKQQKVHRDLLSPAIHFLLPKETEAEHVVNYNSY